MKKIGHIIAWVLAGIVLFVLAVVLFTQTPWFRTLVLNKVVTSANKVLNAKFSIGKLEGNLINHIVMHDVRLIREQDTVAYISRVDIGLNPVRLLDKRMSIDSLVVDSMVAVVRQYRDSSWNIAGLYKQDTMILKDTSRVRSPFKYTVRIGDFVLRNSSARIFAIDTTVPQRVNDIRVRFSADYSRGDQQLEMKELHFQTLDPVFQLQNLSFVVTRNKDSVTVSKFVIQTAENRIEANGSYAPSEPRRGAAEVSVGPLKLSEFSRFLPNIRLPLSPQVSFNARLVKDTVFAKLGLGTTDQSTSFDVVVYPISKAIRSSTINQVNYRVNGVLKNVDVARWSGDTTFAYTLTGKFTLNGYGINPDSMRAVMTGDLSDCKVLGRQVQQATWNVNVDSGNVQGIARFAGAFGDINFSALTIDLLHTQAYKATFVTTKLDLSQLFNDTTLKSDLNLAVVASGTHFSPKEATGTVQLTLKNSAMYGYAADTGALRAAFTPNEYTIDTGFVTSKYGTINLGGKLSKRSEAQLHYTANLGNLTAFKEILKVDTLRGTMTLAGTATGTLDSLMIDGDYQFHGLAYNAIKIDTGAGKLAITRIKQRLGGDITVGMGDLRYSKYVIDTAGGKITLRDSVYAVAMDFQHKDSIKGHVDVDVRQGTTPVYVFKHIDVTLYGQHWTGGSDQTTVRALPDAYDIANLSLTSGGGGNQHVKVDGRYSSTGAENLKLDIASLEIAAAARLFGYTYPVSGALTTTGTLTGTAASPVIQGKFELANGKFNQFTFQSLTSTISYAPDKFTLTGELIPVANSSLTVEGFMPMHISLTDTTGQMIIRKSPVQLRVVVNQFPLSILEALGDQIRTTGGTIVGDFTLAGSLDNPNMSGKAGIVNGGFVIKQYGIEYNDFNMSLAFNNTKIVLDSLHINRGKGFMRANGELDFSGGLMAGNISTTDVDWRAQDFYLVRHSDLEIQLTGSAKLSGPTGSPKYSGDITVNRSRVYVPILSDEAKKSVRDIPKPPLMVQATGLRFKSDTASAAPDTTGKNNVVKSINFYRDLRGTAKLTIPRNTWLTGPDMNIEIAGDLQLVKNSPEYFEIFGPINIVRGKYSLFGKRFQITDGTLTFTGGKDINPQIDMNAQYTFRAADRSKRVVTVHATGKAFNPDLAFTLDGADVAERDAIAYIVFGKSMADVTGPGGAGGSFQGTEFAKGAAANALAGELAKTLGKRFALDVIEISSAGSFQSATVTVGKYITNNLFMSYERGIGEETGNEVVPAVVTLEYELTKNVSAQLVQGESQSSGFDLIFKFDH